MGVQRAEECSRIEKCGFLSRIWLTGFVGWGKFPEIDFGRKKCRLQNLVAEIVGEESIDEGVGKSNLESKLCGEEWIKGSILVTELLLFLKLPVFRAVEFFIRDKYEKKKYYDKNAIAVTNVSKTFSSIANWHLFNRSCAFNIQLNCIYCKNIPVTYILKLEYWKYFVTF